HQQAIRTGRGDRRRRKGVAAYDGTRGRGDRAYIGVGTIDAPAGAIVGGNPFTTPPITTTGPNRLLVSFFYNNSIVAASWTPPPGWSGRITQDALLADDPAPMAGAMSAVSALCSSGS